MAMVWSVEARRRGPIVDVTVRNPGPAPIGPFVIRLHPPSRQSPIRVERVDAGAEGPTVSVDDPAYQLMYVTAELLNEVALIERIRSCEVS